MDMPFMRENRYIVFKAKDQPETRVRLMLDIMKDWGVEPVAGVVVEKDWPEYAAVWDMIEARMCAEFPVIEAAEIYDARRTQFERFAEIRNLNTTLGASPNTYMHPCTEAAYAAWCTAKEVYE